MNISLKRNLNHYLTSIHSLIISLGCLNNQTPTHNNNKNGKIKLHVYYKAKIQTKEHCTLYSINKETRLLLLTDCFLFLLVKVQEHFDKGH